MDKYILVNEGLVISLPIPLKEAEDRKSKLKKHYPKIKIVKHEPNNKE